MRLSTRNRLVMAHLPAVRTIARLVRSNPLCPWQVEIADLVHEGILALLRLASRYDDEQGKFWTYAEQRVKGQMLDYLRRNGWPNRYYRRRAILAGDVIAKMETLTDKHIQTIPCKENPDADVQEACDPARRARNPRRRPRRCRC